MNEPDGVKEKKQKKIVTETSNPTVTTEYAGNYIYEGNALQFFNQPEGYVEPKDPNNYGLGFEYIYQYKDHLGNIRLSYSDSNSNGSVTSNEIWEENNYYPFGLKHKGYGAPQGAFRDHKFGFGGKEVQDDNVGASLLNWLDFGWRNYDTSIGRWMNFDIMAEELYNLSNSTYNYYVNNPIIFYDPDGRDWFYNENTGDVIYISNLHKGAEKHMVEGWQHMGENGMFKDKESNNNDDLQVISDNEDLAESYGINENIFNSDGISSKFSYSYFKGANAEKLMANNDYTLVPAKALFEESTRYLQNSIRVTVTEKITTELWLQKEYVKTDKVQEVIRFKQNYSVGIPSGFYSIYEKKYQYRDRKWYELKLVKPTVENIFKGLDAWGGTISVDNVHLKVYKRLKDYPSDGTLRKNIN